MTTKQRSSGGVQVLTVCVTVAALLLAVLTVAATARWWQGPASSKPAEGYAEARGTPSQSQSQSPSTWTYYRLDDDLDRSRRTLPLPQAIEDISNARGGALVPSASYLQAQFLLFESFNRIDQTLDALPLPPGLKFIYGLRGSDLLASKGALAETMQAARLNRFMPTTYVLRSTSDVQKLQAQYNSKQVYILKKDVQRQEGVLLTSSLQEILDVRNEYVVAQVVLQDPLLVGGRKVNMRVYLLVVADEHDQSVHMYMYKDGFMYYTPRQFQPYTVDEETNITTGYIDRQVYAENPLTIQDLVGVLGQARFDRLMSNTQDMLKAVAGAYVGPLKQSNRGIPGIKFAVFGADVAPAADLSVRIMEINKGPDLSYKDDRDKAVKHYMLLEAFARAGVVSAGKRAEHPMFVQLV